MIKDEDRILVVDGAETDARIGLTIAGKYRVDEVVGHGGMGTVYRGTHLELDAAPIALKFLHRMYSSTAELRARFRREAVALARLRHPSIVSLLDFGEHDDELFMVMELVVGQSLAKLLEDSAPSEEEGTKGTEGTESSRASSLSIPFIGELFDALLDVLETAHAAGIVHRDLKPSNVMVVATNPPALDHIKLLDFGLVHLPGMSLEKLTQTGVVHGTPEYMSPEQCQGDEVGPPTDIYALGVMLYECIAGRTPFGGRGVAQIMAQHMFVPPPSLSTLSSSTSSSSSGAAFDDLVRRALSKSAAQRPTATDMRAELAQIIRGTDPLSIAERASHERTRDASMSRSERALTGRPPATAVTAINVASSRRAETKEKETHVTIQVKNKERASSIRDALSVGGISVRASSTTSSGEHGPHVVIVSARDEGGIEALSSVSTSTSARVIVVDVKGPEEMSACVRAGASDMLLVESPDSDLALRVTRILKRGR